MEIVGGREEKMEGHFSTGQSPHWTVVPMEEEDKILPVNFYCRRISLRFLCVVSIMGIRTNLGAFNFA